MNLEKSMCLILLKKCLNTYFISHFGNAQMKTPLDGESRGVDIQLGYPSVPRQMRGRSWTAAQYFSYPDSSVVGHSTRPYMGTNEYRTWGYQEGKVASL